MRNNVRNNARNYTAAFFGYCSDRKRAGVFACPFGVASVEKV